MREQVEAITDAAMAACLNMPPNIARNPFTTHRSLTAITHSQRSQTRSDDPRETSDPTAESVEDADDEPSAHAEDGHAGHRGDDLGSQSSRRHGHQEFHNTQTRQFPLNLVAPRNGDAHAVVEAEIHHAAIAAVQRAQLVTQAGDPAQTGAAPKDQTAVNPRANGPRAVCAYLDSVANGSRGGIDTGTAVAAILADGGAVYFTKQNLDTANINDRIGLIRRINAVARIKGG